MAAIALITLAQESNAQTWALLLALLGVLATVLIAWVKSLLADRARAQTEIKALQDQSASTRHETLVTKLNGLDSGVSGLRGEVHAVNERVGRVEGRVDQIEQRVKRGGAGGDA